MQQGESSKSGGQCTQRHLVDLDRGERRQQMLPPSEPNRLTVGVLILTMVAPTAVAGRMGKPTGTEFALGPRARASTAVPGIMDLKSRESTPGQGK